jgi:riboflavin synthase
MFTGIVEEVGRIAGLRKRGQSVVFNIRAKNVARGTKEGDSIAVNGVCLTVTEKRGRQCTVRAVEETLSKTNLGMLREGDPVNLERSLLPTTRLGGHFVLGHVDTTGKIESIRELKSSKLVWVSFPRRFSHYLIPVGSVAVNGVSLTVARLTADRFAVSLIPHTLKVTTFGSSRPGDRVNIEFDMLGKYVQQLKRR